MSEPKQPVYQNMFEYMVEHYDFKAPDTPLTKFYKKDIEVVETECWGTGAKACRFEASVKK